MMNNPTQLSKAHLACRRLAILQAELALLQTQSLGRAILRLRHDLRRCQHCPLVCQCQPLGEFQQAIDAAIDQLTTDWGLV